MLMDKSLQLATAQAVTGSAATTNYIDLGSARELGASPHQSILVTVDTAATAAGAATVTFQLQCDSSSSFSAPVTVIQTDAIAKATLVPGYQLILPLPFGLNKQYVRVNFSVATGPLTAGAFSVNVITGVQANKAYPTLSQS